MSRDRPLDVAIVGMSCRGPGAPDLFAYWENVLARRDAGLDRSATGTPPHAEDDEEKRSSVIEVAGAALEDAGLSPDEWNSPRVKVVGWDDDATFPLVRLEEAAQALATHEADLVVVAEEFIEADGHPSGAGVLALKRRVDAERDSDRIYAVVRKVLGADSATVDHTMSAAGMAGLIEAALALYHRIVPPDLHVARPWIHADPAVPRRAGVRELGSAGIRSYVVLEEHASADADAGGPGAMLRWESEAILLSAADRTALADRARELAEWLDAHPDASLKDIAYTLNCADEPTRGASRLGLVAKSPADLSRRLAALWPRLQDPSCRAIVDGRGVYYWDEPLGDAGGLAFLFPGEGSQYPGMLADLCLHFPEVRRLFDTSDRIALEHGDTVPPSEYLFGRGSAAEGGAELWSAPTAVNVILSAQWALYQVLTRLGLRPDAVAGHSSGELLALAAAGVLQTDRELERQLAALGTIFRGLEATGDVPAARLVAVAAGRDRVEAACRAVEAREVAIAIDNCPHQVVLAGPPAEVDRVIGGLRQDNILVEDLPFQRAYHTPAFAPVLGPVAAFFGRLNFHPPRIPVYSCATRGPMPLEPETIRELAISQWTRTVAFRETVEAMYADGLRIFVDAGARGNLAGFVQDTLRGRPAFAMATNLPRRSGPSQLNHLVAALFAQGLPLRPEFLYARRRPRRIDWHERESHARSLIEVKPDFPETNHHNGLARRPRWTSPADPTEQLVGIAHPTFSSDLDAAMLAFQDTMRTFLETQHAVIGAYLGTAPAAIGALGAPDVIAPRKAAPTTSGPEPGPWAGDVRHLVPGCEVEAAYLLDARTDPIAEHHTLGGRRVSALDPTLKGLPVLPFAVMAEMTVQAAALVVTPGLVLARLEHLRARKWVRYEDEPVVLELRGRCEPASHSGEERVWVGLFNRGRGGRVDAPRPVFEAVAVFAGSAPLPSPASCWEPADTRPSRFTAESLYGEQWLFHGPAFQALVEVGEFSGGGIDGVLRVLPWEPLLRPGHTAMFHTDPIVIDSFTHLLGCWGLDYLADRGDVIFPLGMEELQFYGERPAVGTDVACRISVADVQRHRVRATAEMVRPDGTVWMRLHRWEDWRFHWPSRYRDVFRQPQDVFIGEELPLHGADPTIKAVWLAPPADMGRPVWLDVLEQTQLGPAERAEHLAAGGSEDVRSRRLWGRIAAKEAARRIWHAEGRAPTYPADLAIVADERGWPLLIRVDDAGDRTLPSIAIAETDGFAVAVATSEPRSRPGIAVASIRHRPGGPGESGFTEGERALLAEWSGPASLEWAARFRCAKEAAIAAVGTGFAAGSLAAEIIGADESSGILHVRLDSMPAKSLRVASALRADYAWALTLGL